MEYDSMKISKTKELIKMFFIFIRIGVFTIGGGYAMLPLIEKEIVEKLKWFNEEEIIDIFAIVQSVPGIISVNSVIYIGYKKHGIIGAIVSCLGIVLPSFLIIISIAYILVNFKDNVYVQKAFTGVRAGVTALILLAMIKLGSRTISDKFGLILALLGLALITIFEIHAIFAILGGAFAGYIYYVLNKGKKV
jgi:chromate transporter